MKLSALLRTAIVALVLGWPAVSFAQLTVLTSGGFRAPYQEALPAFEGASGIKVTTLSGRPRATARTRLVLSCGAVSRPTWSSCRRKACLSSSPRVCWFGNRRLTWRRPRWARRCAPARRPLTSARSRRSSKRCWAVKTFPGSTTGIYMMKEMFPKLGVAEAIASKITNTGVSAVAAGTADLALQPVSELVHAPGARYIGPIPADVQYVSIFTAALVSKAVPSADAARRMLTFLASDLVATAARNSGMEPITGR